MKTLRWLRIVVWTAVVAVGVGSIAVLAWSCAEVVGASWMVGASGVAWWQFLAGRRTVNLSETPYAPLIRAPAGKRAGEFRRFAELRMRNRVTQFLA